MKAINVLIISVLTLVVGFLVGEAVISEAVIEFAEVDEMTFLNELDKPEIQFFFQHNIIFFLTISILPFINMFIVVIQLFLTGLQISLIQNLSLQMQFNLFYRHLIFEFLALFLAICVSYKIYLLLKDIHQVKRKGIKKRALIVLVFYAGILLSTMIAAILEGSIHV